MSRPRKPTQRARKTSAAKGDKDEIYRLTEELRTEVQSLESTHPKVVELVNALCLTLSRLGI